MINPSQIEMELRRNIKAVLINLDFKKINEHQEVLINSEHTHGLSEQRIYELYFEVAKGTVFKKLIELRVNSKRVDHDFIFDCNEIIKKNLYVMEMCVNGLDQLKVEVSKLDQELATYQKVAYCYINYA